jgi:hypothetical protein
VVTLGTALTFLSNPTVGVYLKLDEVEVQAMKEREFW